MPLVNLLDAQLRRGKNRNVPFYGVAAWSHGYYYFYP